MTMFELQRYASRDGFEPFTQWIQSIRDKGMQARIRLRLQRLVAGNFGDVKTVGGGVSELRMHFGAGYRIYLSRQGKAWVLLLCGGDKSSQSRDIERARAFLKDWKERQ